MTHIFPRKIWFVLIVMVVLALLGGRSAVFGAPSSASDWGKFATSSVTVLTVAALILNQPWVFQPLARRLRQLRVPYFDIAGTYTAHMFSNWPTVERLRNAASSPSEGVDVNQPLDPLEVEAVVVIRCGLFHVEIETKMLKTNHRSVSRGEDYRRGGDGKSRQLSYLYTQCNKPGAYPSATDRAEHSGAAMLDVRHLGSGNVDMQGSYWTNRAYELGLNTAGQISLTRVATITPDIEEAQEALANS